MSLHEKLDAIARNFHENIAPTLPEETIKALVDFPKRLAARNIGDGVIKAGERFPDFQLPEGHGGQVALQGALAGGHAVVFFFRGQWCPYCVAQLKAMEEARPEIESLGATLMAISPQSIMHTEAMVKELGLNYHVLSDRGNRVAAEAGLVFSLDEDVKKASLELGVELSAFNGDDSWTLPLTSLFIIRRDGVVQYSYANSNHRVRVEPREVIDRLAALQEMEQRGETGKGGPGIS